jgi:hypothetical protein
LSRVSRADELIAACTSWGEFSQRVAALPTDNDKGDAFERLVAVHLTTAPEYRAKLADVWPLASVPGEIRRQLDLPRRDEGIDLIARTRDGEFWAVQGLVARIGPSGVEGPSRIGSGLLHDPWTAVVPFKANAARRHRIPRQRHQVTNWAVYDAALRQRGSLTVWFTEAAVAAW